MHVCNVCIAAERKLVLFSFLFYLVVLCTMYEVRSSGKVGI